MIRASLLIGALLASEAQAYVTYNRLGYVSCAACHTVATGAGTLTAYGQSVAAAMSALKSEVEPSEGKVTGGLQARVIGFDEFQAANPFLMQADLLVSAQVTEKARVDAIAGLDLKLDREKFAALNSGWDAYVLRRALVSYDVSETGSVSAGRDWAVAGLNLDDHTALIRTQNRRGIEDTPTQLRYLHQAERIQLLPYLALPSYEELDENREYGVGFRGEYALDDHNSLGVTFLQANSPSITRTSPGVFFRLSQGHSNGFMGEYVFTQRAVHASGAGFGQHNVYLRPYVAWPEWVETSWIYEYFHSGAPFARSGSQFGPEINLRLHRWVSILGDGRNLVMQGSSEWSWYAQLFLHVQI